MVLEYKTVGAPERGRRKRGARSRSDRVAVAVEEILRREAVDGWRYLRTDLIPVEERTGWFGGSREVHRAVMVFCRGDDDLSAQIIEQQSRIEASLRPGSDLRHADPQVRAPSMPAPVAAAPVERAEPQASAPAMPERREPAEPAATTRALAAEMAEEPIAPMPEIDDDAPPAMKINRMMERQRPTLKGAKAANEG